MIQGVSHVTLAVGDLNRAVAFYTDALDLRLAARWEKGAYLAAGDLWLALALDSDADPASGATHLAFTVAADDFGEVRDQILASGAKEWRENRSEGASLYFLDPDGHQLEIHVGTLASRLDALEGSPGVKVYRGAADSDTRPAER